MKPGAKAFQGAKCEARLYSWISEITGATALELVLGRKDIIILNSIDDHLSAWVEVVRISFSGSIRFVALGRNASECLTRIHVRHFKLPHPSGRNRLLNDKNYVNEQLQSCKEWLKGFT